MPYGWTGGCERTVRVQLTQQGRLVVQKAGLRYDDMAGFVADSWEVISTKSTRPSRSAGACRRIRGSRSGMFTRSI